MNRLVWAILLLPILFSKAQAQENPTYSVSFLGNTSSGRFAPYFIGSLNHGKIMQKNSALVEAVAVKEIDLNKRFSWGFGVDAVTGLSSKNSYAYWDKDLLMENDGVGGWETHREGPAAIWLQQLYGQIKYRSVFLTIGMREYESAILNQKLSSGDMTYSGNARPIPEVRVGFLDFVDIPFTKGWLQIQGEISYGKMTENGYLKHHYNYYNYHIALGELYTYKRCYFRTNPDKPFSVTLGMQTAGLFGGTTYYYIKGALEKKEKHNTLLKSFWNMFFPRENNGEDFYEGSSLGSWDLSMRYRTEIGDFKFNFEGPWEDGSSIGRRNGWDGLWGLEFQGNQRRLVNGVVIEIISTRDQSGPIHWNPEDSPGTTITSQATGRDDYYNNYYYNSYANYGMAIGTPFLLSPIYNLDGYPAFACNRMRGGHFGIMGSLGDYVDYRLLVMSQTGYGTYIYPYYEGKKNTSAMLEVSWNAQKWMPGLSVTGSFAFDNGELRGNSVGGYLSVTYKGNFSKRK